MNTAIAMDTVIPGLHASAPQQLPFATSFEVRAFLLERDRGNVIMYSVDGLGSAKGALDELGGVSRQYLNHWHEAMFARDRVAAPLFVHERDRAKVEEHTHVRGAFSRRHVLDDGLEVIPIPGHTPGATAFLWDSGEHRVLFTGDSVYLQDGEWVVALDVTGSDRAAYIKSLELLRTLDFDVVVPWAAARGGPFYTLTDAADARHRIDAVLARVRRGEDR